MQKKVRVCIYIINDTNSQYSVWFRKVGSKSGPHHLRFGTSGVSNSGIIMTNVKHIDVMW